METIKNDLTLALITPMKRPKVYCRGVKPYKAFLFYGPPGTGKTSIAQAVAEEAGGLNFLYLSAGDILSKYIGESEKQMRHLFELARRNKPSIIFIDEIDAVASKRTDLDHSCGTKTELFLQIDSVTGITDGVFFMASTNCPQHLDSALLRRFDKFLYVSLLEEGQRMEIFRKNLADIKSHELSEEDDKFKALAARAKGFSPSDMEKICTDAKNKSLARLLKQNPVKTCGNDTEGEASNNACECCSPILLYDDVLQAIRQVNPSVDPKQIAELEKFRREKGDGQVSYDPPEPISFSDAILDFFLGTCCFK